MGSPGVYPEVQGGGWVRHVSTYYRSLGKMNRREKCICKHCGSHWLCEAAKKRHMKYHKANIREEDKNDDLIDDLTDEVLPEKTVPEEFDMARHVIPP